MLPSKMLTKMRLTKMQLNTAKFTDRKARDHFANFIFERDFDYFGAFAVALSIASVKLMACSEVIWPGAPSMTIWT